MKLLIENWAAIDKAEINLSKPLLVFTGPNGTGKTSYDQSGYVLLHRDFDIRLRILMDMPLI